MQRLHKPLDFMIYIFRMYQVIESSEHYNLITLQGKLRQHMHYCDKEGCTCLTIAESIDETKRYRKIKMEKEEEEHQMMAQQRQNEDNSFGNISQDNLTHEKSTISNFKEAVRSKKSSIFAHASGVSISKK